MFLNPLYAVTAKTIPIYCRLYSKDTDDKVDFKVTSWDTQVTICYGLASVVVRRVLPVNVFFSTITGPIFTNHGI